MEAKTWSATLRSILNKQNKKNKKNKTQNNSNKTTPLWLCWIELQGSPAAAAATIPTSLAFLRPVNNTSGASKFPKMFFEFNLSAVNYKERNKYIKNIGSLDAVTAPW